MFNVYALLLDNALKTATPMIKGAINDKKLSYCWEGDRATRKHAKDS